MTENDLYKQLSAYLNLAHPDLLYHYDLAGIWTPSHKARNLYGLLNRRAFPDLAIYRAAMRKQTTGIYGALFLELKRPGTRLRKRDGVWATEHIAEQAAVLDALREEGYAAEFATTFDEAVEIIESYLAGELRDHYADEDLPEPLDAGEVF